MEARFLQNIVPTDLVLTANKRLASYLQGQYDDYQHKSGTLTWESATFLPLNTWLRVFYQEHRHEPLRILSPTQSHLLWERIIRSSEIETPFQASKTPEIAQQAWLLIQHWELDLSCTDPFFAGWAQEYQNYCDQHQFIDEARLARKVFELCNKNKSIIPGRIHLIGFDNISNIIKRLFDLYKLKSEVKITHFQLENSDHSALLLQNNEHEILTAARWIKYKIQNNPDGLYGCVVPDLVSERDKMLRKFQEILGEETVNISAGKPLIDYPVVHSAVRILALTQQEFDFHQISNILRSPYVKGATGEKVERIQLDNHWREILPLYPTLSELPLIDAPIWAKIWTEFKAFLDTIPDAQKPSAWSDTFQKVLSIIGWPGAQPLMKLEMACVERWDDLLKEFGQLDFVLDNIALNDAFSILENMLKKSVYQSPTPDARVHIIGILESAGLIFDGLWVMGLDDETWPQPLQPNPFITQELQRQLKMPRSNPQYELIYAKNVLNRLTHAAPEVIISYSSYQDDKPLEPSPLLKNIPKIKISDLALAEYTPLSKEIFDQRELEIFDDDQAPSVSADESIHGGTYILKAQALCPFKAFAEVRLNAVSLDEPSLGFDSAERGTFIHEVLAHFWSDVGDSRTLNALSESDLEKKISYAVNRTLFELDSRFRGNDVRLEKQRLKTVIKDWLDYEKERDPFTVVGIEKKLSIKLSELNLHCRIDRIDQLDDGTHVIIDYKTGKSTVTSWFGERPNEPQIPLYCISSDLPVSACVFAECRADSQQFKGISMKANTLPDVKPVEKFDVEWDALLSEWEVSLTELAVEFLRGDAEVDPKHPVLSCQYCELDSLCRIR